MEYLASNQDSIYKLMVEASPNAILLVDTQCLIVYMNSFAEKLFGYLRKDLIGKNIDTLIPTTHNDTQQEVLINFFENPITRELGKGNELNAAKQDGTIFPIEIGISPVVKQHGTMAVTIIIDILERKRSEQQFKLMVESVPNSIIIVNAEGKITMINHRVEYLFGYTNDELIGADLSILLPERYRHTHSNLRELFMHNPSVRAMGAGQELWARKKDGSEFPVEIGLNPIDTNQGLQILTSIIDISERKKKDTAK